MGQGVLSRSQYWCYYLFERWIRIRRSFNDFGKLLYLGCFVLIEPFVSFRILRSSGSWTSDSMYVLLCRCAAPLYWNMYWRRNFEDQRMLLSIYVVFLSRQFDVSFAFYTLLGMKTSKHVICCNNLRWELRFLLVILTSALRCGWYHRVYKNGLWPSSRSSFRGTFWNRCEQADMEMFAMHLLVLAHAYMIPALKRLCTDHFEHGLLNSDNVVDVLKIAR